VVNLGAAPVFGYQDVESAPAGLPSDGGLDLVSLEEQFDGVFGGTAFLPPLDPWSAVDGTADITDIVGEWSAYGEEGAIEDPVEVIEPASVAWGIELEEPFDESCAITNWLGRAWQGQSVTSSNPPFTAEALDQWHPGGTYDVLADDFSRLIEFGCQEGGQPIVRAFRMTDDLGARPFGPIDAVVLVNGRHLVFMHTGRTLTSVFDQDFFATPAGGGPVALSTHTDMDIPLLLPNPYDDLPTRIQLMVDVGEGGGGSWTRRRHPERPGSSFDTTPRPWSGSGFSVAFWRASSTGPISAAPTPKRNSISSSWRCTQSGSMLCSAMTGS
jgi:hypothetical protein